MDSLLKLIAVEGFYQTLKQKALQGGVLLSREDFARTQHTVTIGVDALLLLLAFSYPVAFVATHAPQSGGVAVPMNRAERRRGILH